MNFELQLDSTDDFAIYRNGILESAHQVKANIGKSLSCYIKALEKSSAIEFDRTENILRYFHVSVKLRDEDTVNFKGESGQYVQFYSYGDKKYCGLVEIEALTKEIIKEICDKYKDPNKYETSQKLLHYNYCLLSEKISTQALEIHRMVQDEGIKANQAAYENRITAQSLYDEIFNNNPYNDTEYYAVDLKAKLINFIETKLEEDLTNMSTENREKIWRLHEHILTTDATKLVVLCQLMKPSERFSTIQRNDIRNYLNVIKLINIEPILEQVPHYLDAENRFYLPTALSFDDHQDCRADIQEEMESNTDLLKLLFEYNNLIAYKLDNSFVIKNKYTHTDELSYQNVKDPIDSNITKPFCLSILNIEKAKEQLNDN